MLQLAGVAEQVSTLLMKRSPFTREEIAAIERWCTKSRLLVALAPERVSDTVVAGDRDGETREEGAWSGVDWSPASDSWRSQMASSRPRWAVVSSMASSAS